MILPEAKRVVRFDRFPGKTIQEVVEGISSIRFLFTDGTFADLDTESKSTSKIVIDKGKPSRLAIRRNYR